MSIHTNPVVGVVFEQSTNVRASVHRNIFERLIALQLGNFVLDMNRIQGQGIDGGGGVDFEDEAILDQPHPCRQVLASCIPGHQTAVGKPRSTLVIPWVTIDSS